jgi:hypothetical protein
MNVNVILKEKVQKPSLSPMITKIGPVGKM